MPPLNNHRHEKFAQALAQGKNATEAHQEAGYKPNRSTACQLKQDPRISTRVAELQEEQLALHQQATVEAAANAKVTIESLIAEAEAARSKAMSEKGGAAAAVSALTAKAKLAGMWREKVDTHNTGTPVYERIERTIVEHHTKPPGADEPVDKRPPQEFEPPTSGRHWAS
jgi:phage terminase small subunit